VLGDPGEDAYMQSLSSSVDEILHCAMHLTPPLLAMYVLDALAEAGYDETAGSAGRLEGCRAVFGLSPAGASCA
jgi:hypothetical protein